MIIDIILFRGQRLRFECDRHHYTQDLKYIILLRDNPAYRPGRNDGTPIHIEFARFNMHHLAGVLVHDTPEAAQSAEAMQVATLAG